MKIAIILFMILILILAAIPIGKIKLQIKENFGILTAIRAQLQNLLRTEISFIALQNFLHLPFFALLSFLWMKLFSLRNLSTNKAVILTLAITLFFALFEEASQGFISGRDASWRDLFLNFTGCLTGIVIFKLR